MTPAGRTRAQLTRNAPCWTATPRGLLHANAPEERMSMRMGGVSLVSRTPEPTSMLANMILNQKCNYFMYCMSDEILLLCIFLYLTMSN